MYCLKIYLFWTRVTDRKQDKILHPMIHSADSYNGLMWVMMKPAAVVFILISSVNVRHQSIWIIFHCFSERDEGASSLSRCLLCVVATVGLWEGQELEACSRFAPIDGRNTLTWLGSLLLFPRDCGSRKLSFGGGPHFQNPSLGLRYLNEHFNCD